MIGDNGRPSNLRFCLFEMYVNVVFVITCLYSAVSLTLVREQCFIRMIIIINREKVATLTLKAKMPAVTVDAHSKPWYSCMVLPTVGPMNVLSTNNISIIV